MPFKNTEQLIHDYNTSPLAKLPMLNDILANLVTANDGINLSKENAKIIRESFLTEYHENNEGKVPFYGCPNKVFIQSYKEDLKNFLTQFIDANEADFIEIELAVGIMKFEFPYAGDYMNATIRISLKRRYEFLIERLEILGYDLHYFIEKGDNYTLGYIEKFKIQRRKSFKNEQKKKSSLKWHFSQSDLIELTKGLYESKVFGKEATEKNIVENLELAFNFKINNYEQAKSKIRNRVKDLTPFLDKLKLNIVKWRDLRDGNPDKEN